LIVDSEEGSLARIRPLLLLAGLRSGRPGSPDLHAAAAGTGTAVPADWMVARSPSRTRLRMRNGKQVIEKVTRASAMVVVD
jgi:hypothetical protein